jgi:hypothetical protein
MNIPERFQKKESKSDEYGIGFWAHGEYHEVTIDLDCLRNALKPQPAPEPQYGQSADLKQPEKCGGINNDEYYI